MLLRAERHFGDRGVGRILYHRDPAAALDRPEPGGSVVKRAGEHDADNTSAETAGGGTKQWIDRRPGQVFARAAAQQHVILMQRQMAPRGRHSRRAPA